MAYSLEEDVFEMIKSALSILHTHTHTHTRAQPCIAAYCYCHQASRQDGACAVAARQPDMPGILAVVIGTHVPENDTCTDHSMKKHVMVPMQNPHLRPLNALSSVVSHWFYIE